MKGALFITGDSALGSSANAIFLGSGGNYGVLRGKADGDVNGTRVDRAVTLNGVLATS